MVAREIIDNLIAPLKTSETGEYALQCMSDACIRHIPIVNDKLLLGTLSEDDILDHDMMEPIASYSLTLNQAFVREEDHIFEIIQALAEQQLTAIPVVDSEYNYLGTVSLQSLIRCFAESYSFKDPGSIIVLNIPERDYVLSEIARLAETENARIISTFITRGKEEGSILVTLKLNTQHISALLATFRRFNYDVYSSFTEPEYLDSLKERYEGLMSYLNV
jgi:predicted transcriptional regulator